MITKVSMRLPIIGSRRELVGMAVVQMDDGVEIKDIDIIAKRNGTLFVGMPSVRTFGYPDNPRKKVFHNEDGRPYWNRELVSLINHDTRRLWEDCLIDAYYQLEESGESKIELVRPPRQANTLAS